MKLEELQVYNLAMDLGEKVWQIVSGWNYFEKDTIGKQWVGSADSVAANISEGFGRFHYKETKLFGYYARGSLFESRTWLCKAHERNLVSKEDFNTMMRKLDSLGVKLNNYIRSIGRKDDQIKEEPGVYTYSWSSNEDLHDNP